MRKHRTLSSKQMGWITLALLISVAGLLVLVYFIMQPPQKLAEQARVSEQSVADAALLDEQTCGECHAQQVADWLGSHHEQAMQEAGPETVLGNFENAVFDDGAVTSRFLQKDGQFIINTVGADGEYADFTVRYTFGITPLQQYLLELPRGRLQAFTVAWDTQQQRWFSLYPGETFEPGERLHWTARGFTANSSCIDCHVTGLELGYDLESDSYRSTWDAVNVSCQACHLATEAHRREAEEAEQSAAETADGDSGFQIDYQSLTPQEQVGLCARCHSRRSPISPQATYAAPLLDDYMPELLHAGYYHADGQMLDEVFNYGSFLQSKMYDAGLSCTTCHDPHTLKLRLPGNQLCSSCHQLNAPVATYPTLTAKEYDSAAHHFHKAGSAGSRCVDCHMPATTYMVVDPRHDHSFSIPRPDLTLQWGTPNACAQCHSDVGETAAEVAEWSANAMDKWYGTGWRQRPSTAGLMTVAQRGDAAAAVPLLTLIEDRAQPAILRATAADLMAQYGVNAITELTPQVTDPSPLVRIGVVRALANLPDEQKAPLLAPLLEDPVRAVRIETASALAAFPAAALTTEQQNAFNTALDEYEEAQSVLADHPEGHMNLGNLYARRGATAQAEAAYLAAIARGPDFSPARIALATFYYQLGRIAEAEEALRSGIEAQPKQGDLYYSLGLFLVQQQRMEEAAASLAKAAEWMPTQARVHYNYGLLLHRLGRSVEAEAALQQAYALESDNPDILFALATFYRDQRQWQKGVAYAERLVQLQPDVRQYQELFALLRSNSQP